MQILYRFWVGAAGVAAILHNELIVSSHSVFDGLNYNGLLCNIALEGFWLRGLENSSLFFYIKPNKQLSRLIKKQCAVYALGKPKPCERWQSAGLGG